MASKTAAAAAAAKAAKSKGKAPPPKKPAPKPAAVLAQVQKQGYTVIFRQAKFVLLRSPHWSWAHSRGAGPRLFTYSWRDSQFIHRTDIGSIECTRCRRTDARSLL